MLTGGPLVQSVVRTISAAAPAAVEAEWAGMSQDNVNLVNALIPQDTDIVPLFRDDDTFARVREALLPLLTDDFENVVFLPGHTRTHGGPNGLRNNWLDWLEPWMAYRVTIDEVIDLGERVLVLTRNYGRRKDMQTEVEMVAAVILTFREGKVARWEDYANRAAGLRAAGLSE
jgi:ketosteroid isomerase-like protein